MQPKLLYSLFALCTLAACISSPPSSPHGQPIAQIHPSPPPPPLPISTGIDQQLDIPVTGPPEASIATWILEPLKGTPIRGTILLLHGFMADHSQLRGAGESLRKSGYRAVLIDLRGFGQSTGEKITFGLLDAHDLTQLTDTLIAKNLCGPTLGVYGTSYGAASAIMYAGIDPRVTAVVAIASFATIEDEVPSFSRFVLPVANRLFSDATMTKIASYATGFLGFDMDLKGSRPVDSIAKTKARILLVHGDADDIIPHAASETLHTANPITTEILTMPGHGHLDLCFDHPGILFAPTRTWFDRWLGK